MSFTQIRPFLLVALVGAAGASATLWRSWDGGARAWRQLLATLPDERLFEPRVSDLPFARWSPVRGAEAPAVPTERALAAALLAQEAERAPSSLAYRRAAVARLATFDAHGAVALLEEAVRAGIADPAVRSDLAAAYLVRAEASGELLDNVRALDAARRATLADPAASTGWFNQAMALQRLGLHEDAREAWLQASEGEDERWGSEAAERQQLVPQETGRAEALARLEALYNASDIDGLVRAARVDPDLVGEVFEQRVLRAWADAVLAGDGTRAQDVTTEGAAIAGAILKATGDAAYGDVLEALTACDSAPRCAEGWLHHLRALELQGASDWGGAASASGTADALLGTDTSPTTAWRTPLRTSVLRVRGDTIQATGELERLRPYAQARRYWTIAGRLHWQTALFRSEGGFWGRALATYLAALDLLRRARDREGEAVVNSLLAEVHMELDDPGRAWAREFDALAGLRFARDSRSVLVLQQAGTLSSTFGLDAAALAFRAPLVRKAEAAGHLVLMAERLAEDAVDLHELGLAEQAQRRLEEAARWASRIDDSGVREMSEATIRISGGRTLLDTKPLAAAALLEEAIGIYRRRNTSVFVPELQLDRARALVRAGRVALAEGALADGIAAAERDRESVTTDGQRASALAARWELYAWLVDLTLRRDEREALGWLRQARAVATVAQRGSLDASVEYIPPPDTLAVEYAVLPSGTYGWVTSASGRRRYRVDESIESLATVIDGYRGAIQRRDHAEAIEQSRRLHALLLQPLSGELRRVRHLVLVPDGPLHDLPFASLQDSGTGRFLIEQVSIVVTPSLALYARDPRRPRLPAGDLQALVIGNPDRTRATQDRLPNLLAAEQEARTVATLYTPAALAVREAATAAYFIERMPRAPVIHFAGHAVVSETRPDQSRLLLAPSLSDPEGAVSAREIERLPLGVTRLVVLSACDTARGRVTRGEGVTGLVRAFLTAGVPSVVATLWAVDDRSTEALFTAFHESWIQGHASADALREAQIAMIRKGSDLSDWAAALVVGASVAR